MEDKVGMVAQKNGETIRIRLKNVKLVPDLYVNQFSQSAALREGCTLEGSANELIIKKNDKKYTFDQKIESGKGFVFGIKVKELSYLGGNNKKKKDKKKTYDIM